MARPSIRSGRLKQRITIQQKNPTRDSHGQERPGWETFAAVWAEVMPSLGREYLDAAQEQVQAPVKIRIRFRSGVTTAMRVVYGSREFDIMAVIDVNEERREMILQCKELFHEP